MPVRTDSEFGSFVCRRRMAWSQRLLATSADCRRPVAVGALHTKPGGDHVAEQAQDQPNRNVFASTSGTRAFRISGLPNGTVKN